MALFSEVKCSRCDRRYSGLRSRCPYCGARRSKHGKFARGEEIPKSRLIIALLLMAIVVVAVVVLIVTSLGGEDADDPITSPSFENTAVLPPEPSVDTATDSPLPTEPLPSETVSPSPSLPVAAIQSVAITYSGSELTEFTVQLGEKVPLKVKITPADTELVPTWVSSDTEVFAVVPGEDGRSATVTGIGGGSATLTVTVGDVTATCKVYGPSGG